MTLRFTETTPDTTEMEQQWIKQFRLTIYMNIHINANYSNYIHYKVWGEMTYSFQNVNGTTVEVWEWISDFIPYLTVHMITWPSCGLKLIDVNKRDPCHLSLYWLLMWLLSIRNWISVILIWLVLQTLKKTWASPLITLSMKGIARPCVVATFLKHWQKWKLLAATSAYRSLHSMTPWDIQYIPRNMHTVLLCFALLWLCNRS